MCSSSFRVAHVTDLHRRKFLPGTSLVAKRRSREPFLEHILETVRQQNIDLLILTGDILDVPSFLLDGIPHGFQSPGDTDQWLEAAREDYKEVRRLLDATRIPYRILPGNHDYAPLFFEVFPTIESEIRAGGYRWITFNDFEQAGHIPRRLEESMRLFRRVLKDDDATPQIHLQHYLLRNVPHTDYPYVYQEAPWLCSQISDSRRVRLSLSGHYHPGRPLEEENGTLYTVGEALCESPFRWRIYTFSTDGKITMETQNLPIAPDRPVVFLDRDGVINDLPSYTYGPEKMRLLPGAGTAIRRLHAAGYCVVVATSQSAIGQGYVTESVVAMTNEKMQLLLSREGAHVDAIYHTSGAGESSVLPEDRLKPTKKSTLLKKAFSELSLSREGAIIIGDRLSDIEAGREVQIGGILVRSEQEPQHEKQALAENIPVVDDLQSAVDAILS